MTTKQTKQNTYAKLEEEIVRQDEVIDEIGQAVGDLKSIAIEMGAELNEHKVIINDITNHVDDTDASLRRVTWKTTLLTKAQSNCKFIGLVLFLIALIITIVLIILYGGVVN